MSYEQALSLCGACAPTWALKRIVETHPHGDVVREAARVVIQFRNRKRRA